MNDVIPQIDWINIPGKYYAIGKYPVTNAQYQKFVDAADGYGDDRWWSYEKKVQKWRKENPDPLEGTGPDQNAPRDYLCWYEAVGFCLWLSDKTGQKITLPTEEQWLYAAQGDDDRKYPWGNEWDETRCHNFFITDGPRFPVPVTTYEGLGDSPFGVVDMAGNTYEWCLTDKRTGDNDITKSARNRVIRSASSSCMNKLDYRCKERSWDTPQMRSPGWGFRVVLLR